MKNFKYYITFCLICALSSQFNNNERMGGDIVGERSEDYFGWSVSLNSNGRRIAIGAPYNDDSSIDAGQTKVYEYTIDRWVQMGADIDGESSQDNFGWSVSLNSKGRRVAIGAPDNDDSGTDAGQTRVYEYSIDRWVQMGADIDGECAQDYSGRSVSLNSSGSRVAIGSPYNDDSGTDAGQTRVYEYIIDRWVQMGADIDGEASNDHFGWSVSL
ncbi:T9SS C-terminal target domain-containing protein, partial [Candidatus Marinimicrobia bacterium]|nr:T9SS C-terminal target domain-containing protein [Candidatus Neomarinimicrobiota bacterium]